MKVSKAIKRMVRWGIIGILGISGILLADIEMSQTPSPQTPPSSPPPRQPEMAMKASALEAKFLKAQRAEFLYIQQQQLAEVKALIATQKADKNEWMKKEAEARHKYFQGRKGPERRTYVQEFRERQEVFKKVQKDDLAQKRKDHAIRLDAYRQEHESKLREFREYQKRGETPPDYLWPKAVP